MDNKRITRVTSFKYIYMLVRFTWDGFVARSGYLCIPCGAWPSPTGNRSLWTTRACPGRNTGFWWVTPPRRWTPRTTRRAGWCQLSRYWIWPHSAYWPIAFPGVPWSCPVGHTRWLSRALITILHVTPIMCTV